MLLLFILAESYDEECQRKYNQGNIQFEHITRSINNKGHEDHSDPNKQNCDKY